MDIYGDRDNEMEILFRPMMAIRVGDSSLLDIAQRYLSSTGQGALLLYAISSLDMMLQTVLVPPLAYHSLDAVYYMAICLSF